MDSSTVEIICSLITTVGFPIVCCIFLWKYISETMKEFTKSINANTQMLSRVCDKLDLWKEDKNE